ANKTKLEDNWLTYRIAMEPKNGMPCCFQGRNQVECSLSKRRNSWGTTSELSEDSKTLDIFFRLQDGKPQDLFFAGSECPVNAESKKVFTLANVSQEKSIRFLTELVKDELDSDGKELAHTKGNKALAGLALHQGDRAHESLVEFANSKHKKLARKAVFWLGEARNKAGYSSLVKILDDSHLDNKLKEHAVFSLSQNSEPRAMVKLIELAKSAGSDKIRSKAIFWLAEKRHTEVLTVIDDILASDESEFLKKKAVFALSEFGTDESWQKLVAVATEKNNSKSREQAIFWLSQTRDRNAKPILLSIIDGANPESIKIKTVFALSQLKEPDATDGLIYVMKKSQSRQLKKKAMFWLGQSNSPRALEVLEQVLTASVD
ncbi:MAG: HEAT repeat domain-containing protein, partial [Kangiellaceae bacterium]|nr:HEAT repeat domain-containing protein [Kangiellaceae bacterium]